MTFDNRTVKPFDEFQTIVIKPVDRNYIKMREKTESMSAADKRHALWEAVKQAKRKGVYG